MKNKKLYIVIGFIIISLTLGFLSILSLGNNAKNNLIDNSDINQINEVKESIITLNVQNKTYIIQIKNGNTVYDAMNILENTKESNFTFNYKEYPSLGIFVDSINNVKGTPNKYWIYYVNSKEASIGVSKYVLKSGDIVSWKQGAF